MSPGVGYEVNRHRNHTAREAMPQGKFDENGEGKHGLSAFVCTKRFGGIVIKACLVGAVVGMVISRMGMYNVGKSESNCAVKGMNERGMKSNVDICTRAKIWNGVHFVGPNVATLSGVSLQVCCAECAKYDECVAISFSYLESLCTIFKQVVYKSFRKSWTQSVILSDTQQIIGGFIQDLVNNDVIKPREATWWSPFKTFESTLRKLTYYVQETYSDRTGKRKVRYDYKRDVNQVLSELGMTKADQNHHDLYWGLQWQELEDFNRANLTHEQHINMLPGAANLVLGEKDALHKTRLEAMQLHPKNVIDQFIPLSFLLPDEQNRFLEVANEFTWIWKPLGTWSGDGISVLTGTQAKEKLEKTPDEKVVLQQYVINPLTFSGFKFDTRWWAVITDVNPLRVYVLPDAYVRISSTVTYNPSETKFTDRCMHITNGKVQKQCESRQAKKSQQQRNRFPKNFRNIHFSRGLADSTGKRLMHGVSVSDKLVSETKSVIIRSILMGLPQLKMLRSTTRARTFVMLAYDIIYDDKRLQPWVEEINTNGYVGGGIKALSPDNAFLRDMFSLVGGIGYNRSEYQERLEREVSAMHIHDTNLILSLQDTIDELSHKGTWDMIYPFPAMINDTLVKAMSQRVETTQTEYHRILAKLLDVFPNLSPHK